MRCLRGLAILNMLIFVILFTIVSGIIMTIASTQTRLIERYIRRTKAVYAAEAGAVVGSDYQRRNAWFFNLPVRVDWDYDLVPGVIRLNKTTTVTWFSGVGINATNVINSSINFGASW